MQHFQSNLSFTREPSKFVHKIRDVIQVSVKYDPLQILMRHKSETITLTTVNDLEFEKKSMGINNKVLVERA